MERERDQVAVACDSDRLVGVARAELVEDGAHAPLGGAGRLATEQRVAEVVPAAAAVLLPVRQVAGREKAFARSGITVIPSPAASASGAMVWIARGYGLE